MTDPAQSQPHRPASDEEVVETVAFALRYEGRRRVRDADDAMARIAATRIVRLLRASGYTVSKGTTAAAPSTAAHMPGKDRLKP